MVSIIVPIYNVEPYLERCIASLQNQDYRDIEIILVDDGSTDNSFAIVNRFAIRDKRIIAIQKENGGVSSARNVGLDTAQGRYILFVDGDDYVDKDYVSYFLKTIQDTNCKIGMNKVNYVDEKLRGKQRDDAITVPSEIAMEYIFLDKIFVAVWNKIYEASFLKENGIRFNENIWYGEGMLFNIECLSKLQTVALGEKCVYHQVSNRNSAMRKFNLKSNHCGIRSLDLQFEYLNLENKFLIHAWEYHRWRFNWQIACGLTDPKLKADNINEFKSCIENLKHGLKYPMRARLNLKKKIINILICLFPKLMIKLKRRWAI